MFFSATLLPMGYYRSLFSTREDDYAICAASPFPRENLKLLIARDVSSKYTRRGEEEYGKLCLLYTSRFSDGPVFRRIFPLGPHSGLHRPCLLYTSSEFTIGFVSQVEESKAFKRCAERILFSAQDDRGTAYTVTRGIDSVSYTHLVRPVQQN